jgi:hypothetical protein
MTIVLALHRRDFVLIAADGRGTTYNDNGKATFDDMVEKVEHRPTF